MRMRNRRSSSRTVIRAGWKKRSTPMAVASPTCIPECTACTRSRRASPRCAAGHRAGAVANETKIAVLPRRRRHVRPPSGTIVLTTRGTRQTKSTARTRSLVTGAGRGIGGETRAVRGGRRHGLGQRSGGPPDGRGSSASPVRRSSRSFRRAAGTAVPQFRVGLVAEKKLSPRARSVKTATDHFGRLDGVVNNAASCATRLFHTMRVKPSRAVIKVIAGLFYRSRRPRRGIFRRRQESGSFRAIHLASGLIRPPLARLTTQPPSSACRPVDTIALDMGRFNVRSNLVFAFAWTPMDRTPSRREGPSRKASVRRSSRWDRKDRADLRPLPSPRDAPGTSRGKSRAAERVFRCPKSTRCARCTGAKATRSRSLKTRMRAEGRSTSSIVPPTIFPWIRVGSRYSRHSGILHADLWFSCPESPCFMPDCRPMGPPNTNLGRGGNQPRY